MIRDSLNNGVSLKIYKVLQANFSAGFEKFSKSKTLVVFSLLKYDIFLHFFGFKNKTIHKPNKCYHLFSDLKFCLTHFSKEK